MKKKGEKNMWIVMIVAFMLLAIPVLYKIFSEDEPQQAQQKVDATTSAAQN